MAKAKMDLSGFVGKLLEEQDGDTLREGIRVLSQALMESEVSGLIGAERYERSGERSSYRNGYRLRSWDTRGRSSWRSRGSGRGATFRRFWSPVGERRGRFRRSSRRLTSTGFRPARWTRC